MFDPRALETSAQEIPTTPDVLGELAASRPLHELIQNAPIIPSDYSYGDVRYTFSNDDSAGYFDQLQARSLTSEYREATNRTAVVVGESSLMAALPFIPEDTIVVIDNSPDMCAFMDHYVRLLREHDNLRDWGSDIGFNDGGFDPEVRGTIQRFAQQALEWVFSGEPHPFANEEAYEAAHEQIKGKAVIPWNADITKPRDMQRLGAALRSLGANVTMLNLTNAILDPAGLDHSREYAEILAELPVTEHAPILTTSYIPKDTCHPSAIPGRIVEATGPFFGLKNLAEHGGELTEHSMGRVAVRHFSDGTTSAERGRNSREEDMIMALMETMLGARRFERVKQPSQFEIYSLGGDGVERISMEELPADVRRIIDDLGV
ncbi:MAG: hypothetical protein ACHQT9_03460 [Candidatus Saccharimonadales bacterium]